jgi:hypothetical protein
MNDDDSPLPLNVLDESNEENNNNELNNSARTIQATHIDDIDEINKSGSLEGVMFYQGDNSSDGKESISDISLQNVASNVIDNKSSNILNSVILPVHSSNIMHSVLSWPKPSTIRSGTLSFKTPLEKILNSSNKQSNEKLTIQHITTSLINCKEPDNEKKIELLLLESDSDDDDSNDEIDNDDSKNKQQCNHNDCEIHNENVAPIDEKIEDVPIKLIEYIDTSSRRARSSGTSFRTAGSGGNNNSNNITHNITLAGYHSSDITMIKEIKNEVKNDDTEQKSDNITNEINYENKSALESENDKNLMIYSHFFELNDTQTKFILNVTDLLKEISVVLFFHLFLGIHNAISNVITIDGNLSSIIFYMEFVGIDEKKNFLLKNRLMTIDRYIYYLLLFFGCYLFDYITWFKLSGIIIYVASIMISPSIMGQIYNISAYKKIRHILYNGYNHLVQKIICKQLSKIINLVIKNIISNEITFEKYDNVISYEDLIPFYDQFSWVIINKFIMTFILACIFNHFDKGGMKFPMMIYKNLYMKDNKYNITDDKEYFKKIINDKQWNKFMEIYTLNRIIRMLVNDDAQNSILSEQVTKFLKDFVFRVNKILFCWSMMNMDISSFLSRFLNYSYINNLTIGIFGFFLFTSKQKPGRYILNTLIFTILSFYVTERLLVIILCEIFYPIVESKLLTDIMYDTYQSLKSGSIKLYHRTRLESVLLSLLLTYLSYNSYNNAGILFICILNIFVMLRLYLVYIFEYISIPVLKFGSAATIVDPKDTNENIQNIQEKSNGTPSRRGHSNGTPSRSSGTISLINSNKKAIQKEIAESESDTDILLIIYDGIVIILKNNLLIRAINPFKSVEYLDLLRVFSHLFLLLIFGYISNFSVMHIMFLPILAQYITNILM